MSTVRFACVLLSTALLAPLAHAGAQCPALPSVSVTVQSAVIQPAFKLDTEKHLTALAEKVRPGEADALTIVYFGEDTSVTEGTDSQGCRNMDVEVMLRPSSATVYMSSSVLPTSCRYKAVMGHEMHHVQIGQDALDHTAGILQKQLKSVLPGAMEQFKNRHQGRLVAEDIETYVKRRAENAVRIVSAEYQAGNERLDVPAEQQRLYWECQPGPHAYIGTKQIN